MILPLRSCETGSGVSSVLYDMLRRCPRKSVRAGHAFSGLGILPWRTGRPSCVGAASAARACGTSWPSALCFASCTKRGGARGRASISGCMRMGRGSERGASSGRGS